MQILQQGMLYMVNRQLRFAPYLDEKAFCLDENENKISQNYGKRKY